MLADLLAGSFLADAADLIEPAVPRPALRIRDGVMGCWCVVM